MEIRISDASSLFKENGHDLKGIFNLLFSAMIVNEWHPGLEISISEVSFIAARKYICDEIRQFLSGFKPDLKAAEERVQQFHKEHAELKEINAYFQNMSLKEFLFSHNKKRKAFKKRAQELRDMTISVEELLNIAFYKFSQVNGTLAQFKEGFERFASVK